MTPGFADPVLDSQATFRSVLDAMARPGTIHHLPATLTAPPPLGQATAAVLLTLADATTPIWLDPSARAAGDWIAFHCGAPRAGLGQAAVALALAPVGLDLLANGSDEAPEEGATLILQLPALGSGRALRLEGPGLPAPRTFAAEGLAPDFPAAWARNHARFPRGIDLILCAGDAVAAFPRTLAITEG